MKLVTVVFTSDEAAEAFEESIRAGDIVGAQLLEPKGTMTGRLRPETSDEILRRRMMRRYPILEEEYTFGDGLRKAQSGYTHLGDRIVDEPWPMEDRTVDPDTFICTMAGSLCNHDKPAEGHCAFMVCRNYRGSCPKHGTPTFDITKPDDLNDRLEED
jgi:hypothetical protein